MIKFNRNVVLNVLLYMLLFIGGLLFVESLGFNPPVGWIFFGWCFYSACLWTADLIFPITIVEERNLKDLDEHDT